MERNLKELSASVSFTPGRRDFEPLLGLLGGDEEEAELHAERAFVRAGQLAEAWLISRFEETRAPVRARIARVIGRLAALHESDATARAWLLARLGDDDAKTRRNAAAALGKLRGAEIEDALLASFAKTDDVYLQRTIAAALGKLGGARSLAVLAAARSDDTELSRIRDEAVLRLSRDATRGSEGTEKAAIDPRQKTRAPLDLVLRCRRGIEAILVEEAPAAWQAKPGGPGEVRGRFSGALESLFGVRTAISFGFTVPMSRAQPGTDDDLGGAVARAIASEAAWAIFSAFSTGGVRYRIDWAGGGRKRAAVFRAAEEASRLRPQLMNDPSQRNWEVVVAEDESEVELRPRLADPRFSYREKDVPAASHPTLAAALARLAGAQKNDVVWDPFVGSGLELIERARLGPALRLRGSDVDEGALAASKANAARAGVTLELVLEDALRSPFRGATLVITNPPMGRRVKRREDLHAFFDQLIDHLATVLAPGGRVVWISPLPARTARRAAERGFEIPLRRTVDMGGFDAEIQIFQRR